MMKETTMITPEGFVDAKENADCVYDFVANLYIKYHPNVYVAEQAMFELLSHAPRDAEGRFKNKA